MPMLTMVNFQKDKLDKSQSSLQPSNPAFFVLPQHYGNATVMAGYIMFYTPWYTKFHAHSSQTRLICHEVYMYNFVQCMQLYQSQGKVYLISASGDKTINLYDVKVQFLHYCICTIVFGSVLMVCLYNYIMTVFQKCVKLATFKLNEYVMCMCVCGDLLYVGQRNGVVLVINIPVRPISYYGSTTTAPCNCSAFCNKLQICFVLCCLFFWHQISAWCCVKVLSTQIFL